MNKNINGFPPAARQKLMSHHWPGNVRELRNVIERGPDFGDLPRNPGIQPAGFPTRRAFAKGLRPIRPLKESLDESVARFERELITNALEQNDSNLACAAELLGLTRHSLRYRMQRLGMDTYDTPPGKS